MTIKFWNWAARPLPAAMVLFLTFAGGVLISGLFFLIEVFHTRGQLRKARRVCELLEREVDALRNQPLYDELPTPTSSSPSTFDQRLHYEGQPESSVDLLEPKRAR